MRLNPEFNRPEFLEAIFNYAVDGIILIDSRGLIQQVNPAAARLFGYKAEELQGLNVSLLMPMPDKAQHDQYIQNYEAGGPGRIIGIGREVEGMRKDGTRFPFKLGVSEVRLEGARYYAGVIHDISAQKQAQEELRLLNEELERRIEERTEKLAEVVNKLLHTNEAMNKEIQERKQIEAELIQSKLEVQKALEKERELSELKSRFVAMASHEFRTPLSTVLSSTALISRYTETNQQEQRERHIQRIKSAVSNLTNILNDFLSLSKLEEGKLESKFEIFDLKELVKETIEEIQVFAKKGQTIHYEAQHEQDQVCMDPRFLKNICLNLLSNAVKYSGEDKAVRIETRIDQGGIQLNVQDQGIGIPEEEQAHLFERFFRAKNATNIQGTGLGLHIVKRYLDLMDGQIRFESKPSQGTVFKVFLPLH